MSNQSLFGTQTSKGHIDVMLALLELKDKLLYEIVPTLGLSAPVMHALQTHFNSVTAYRKKVPPMLPAPTGGDTLTRSEPDFTWMAAWSLPEKKVAQFIEGILYKDHYKRELKQIVANRQGASEVLKVESVAAVWNAVVEAVANELKSTLGGSAPVDQDPVEQEPSDETLEHVTFIPASADEVAGATIKQYQEQAFTIIDQSITLIVEAKDELGNVEMLRSAINAFDIPPPVVEGSARTYDIAFYDSKLNGESVTHPHLRHCSWRSEHYHKMARAFLRALLPEGADVIDKNNIPDSAMTVVFDGGRTFGGWSETRGCAPASLGPVAVPRLD